MAVLCVKPSSPLPTAQASDAGGEDANNGNYIGWCPSTPALTARACSLQNRDLAGAAAHIAAVVAVGCEVQLATRLSIPVPLGPDTGTHISATVAPQLYGLNHHTYSYFYDSNGNMTSVHPEHPGSTFNGGRGTPHPHMRTRGPLTSGWSQGASSRDAAPGQTSLARDNCPFEATSQLRANTP